MENAARWHTNHKQLEMKEIEREKPEHDEQFIRIM